MFRYYVRHHQGEITYLVLQTTCCDAAIVQSNCNSWFVIYKRYNFAFTEVTKYIYKGKVIPLQPGVAQRVGRGIALLFHDHGTRRGWVDSPTPRPHFTPGKNRYPFYRRLGGSQGRSGRAENLALTRIRSRTVQPVVSRYTDWATRPTIWYMCVCVYIYIYIYIYTHTHTHTQKRFS